MSMDVGNLNGSKETLKLLDFAKTVTESIKSALEKTNKPRKMKTNHRKYIQRKCFTKSGIKRKPYKRGKKEFTNDETHSSLPADDGSVPAEDSFQAMLEQESERLCMSYVYTKDNNDIMEHFSYEDYLFQRESYFQLNGLYNYPPVNPVQMADSSSYNSWQGHYGSQYPPKLKHIDYEQILMNQQRQRAAISQSSYLAALYDERVLNDFTQSALHDMYNDSISCNGYVNRAMSNTTIMSTDLLPH